MEFVLGIVAGIALSTMFVMVMVFFRVPIERIVSIAEKQMKSVGPRPKGFIVMPESDASESRSRIIEENDKKGKDTRLEELE